MTNWKMIAKVVGTLLYIETALLLMCLAVSWFYGEDDFVGFLFSSTATFAGAILLRYFGRDDRNMLSRRDAYLVVTLAWIVFSVFGTIPFITSGYIESFTDAFFESMSGFTTTGATIIDDVEQFPHALLFWRSLMQWIGGLGIVFFTIALLPSMSGGSIRVFAAEATGPIKTKLHPRISTSAQWIWMIYVILTLACIGCFWLFGMDIFDAVNYSMTTTATGGFSTHNASEEFFHSPLIEYTGAIFCFLSGINFVLLWHSVMRGKPLRLFKSIEFRFYLIATLIFTFYVMLELLVQNHYSVEHAFRSAFFTVVSFITTTGLYNDDAGAWPHATWIVLTVCMFIGGMSGSTAGGFKCIRCVMVFKNIKNEFMQLLHPNAILPMNIDGANVSQQKRQSLMALLSIYILLFAIAAFILAASGIDSTNSVTIIVSCLGNVGPTLGIEIGPTMSWSMLPDFAKWMCSFYMLLGRIEIFTVMVILTPSFWKEN